MMMSHKALKIILSFELFPITTFALVSLLFDEFQNKSHASDTYLRKQISLTFATLSAQRVKSHFAKFTKRKFLSKFSLGVQIMLHFTKF